MDRFKRVGILRLLTSPPDVLGKLSIFIVLPVSMVVPVSLYSDRACVIKERHQCGGPWKADAGGLLECRSLRSACDRETLSQDKKLFLD